MNRTSLGALLLLFLALAGAAWTAENPSNGPLPRLKVSDNKRFLVREDGTPFFYLGDTAWEIFYRLTREEAETYLKNRAAKGFTVIQGVALNAFHGLNAPNAYGQAPLLGDDPTKPNEEYFKHVDWVVNKAAELGLYVGLLPAWGDLWSKRGGDGQVVFNPQNAAVYGEWIARRYKDKPIIWILGGDRPVENDQQRETVRAMAAGVRRGDGGAHLITFHPVGGTPLGSATYFPNEPWIDFIMTQNGHGNDFKQYATIRRIYDLTPVKPVLDGEALYEDHPLDFKAPQNGHSIAADVRRPLYWELFTGACGFTYGNHAVWQFYTPGKRRPDNSPLLPWTEALDKPGAAQMQYGRRLIESRPVLTRIPDDTVIVTDPVPTAVPGAGLRRFVATRDEQGRYAMVYVPVSRPFAVHMDKIKGETVRAWWYNPRTGEATRIGEYPARETREFTPPDKGEMTDWVLVLDDAAKNYPPPGQTPKP